MSAPARSIELTQVIEWRNGLSHSVQDSLAAEEPLEIRIHGEPLAVTMRTPGHDVELAAGFLITEGIVESAHQIASLSGRSSALGRDGNRVDVELSGCAFEAGLQQRNFFAASSCGICGKSTIAAIRRRELPALNGDLRVDPDLLCSLPQLLEVEQPVFERTGGLHAAALFARDGRLLALREDIGRHNAVDKVIGWALMEDRLPLSQHLLLVSGRGGFEIAQKAVSAGIPILASVSAPSSLAVKLARELSLTLIGFLRGRRFVVYSGNFRIEKQAGSGS